MVELDASRALLDFVPERPARRHDGPPRGNPRAVEATSSLSLPQQAAPSASTRTSGRFLLPLLLLVLVGQSAWLLWLLRPTAPAGGDASVAAVSITSEPEGAEVTVDGAFLGVTPFAGELPIGAREVQVGEYAVHPLVVQAGGSASLHVVLAAPPPRPMALTGGVVDIASEPPGATVTVDGVPRGTSPVRLDDIAPGAHEVVLSRSGRVLRRLITVHAGVPTSLVVEMAGPR